MKTFFISIITFFISINLFAQEGEKKLPHMQKNYTIAIQPMHIFNTGMRFDFEKRIKNTSSWIQISPSFYWLPELNSKYDYGNNDWYYTYTDHWTVISGEEIQSLAGAGIELNYKRFFNKKETFYYAAGLSYTYYGVDYKGEYWNTYTEDGLEYHYAEYKDLTQNINKLGLNTYIGYQLPTPVFLFDVFAGLGYRHSIRDKSLYAFDDHMLSYGYSGVVFMMGIRLGFKFK